MSNYSSESSFAKAFLTALFSGIIATLICFVFEIWYRMVTLYGPSDYINVSTIIFIVNLLLLVAGVIYYSLKIWLKKGELMYVILLLVIMAFCIWEIVGIHRFKDLKLNREFIQLLGGIVIIIGTAALSIPYIYNNKMITNFFYTTEV